MIKYASVLTFIIFTSTTYADVENIIKSQKDLQNKDNKIKQSENIALSNKSAVDSGKKTFQNNCVLCHGENAKGQGVYSQQLANMPSDLTQIKRKNSGNFPAIKIYEIIDGRGGKNLHGNRAMPIWGSRYEAESLIEISPKYAKTLTRGKILELILYLNSIQE